MEHIYKDRKYEVELGDDGSMDTIICIDGIDHRCSSEDRPGDEKEFMLWFLDMVESIVESDDRYWDA